MLASEIIGAGETERYIHYVLERGQDVQLHYFRFSGSMPDTWNYCETVRQ
jgi:hypothetical protein